MMVLMSQTTAVLTSGLERIPDQLGYLVISEDGVLAVSVQIMFVYRIRLPSSSSPAAICARLQVTGRFCSLLWGHVTLRAVREAGSVWRVVTGPV